MVRIKRKMKKSLLLFSGILVGTCGCMSAKNLQTVPRNDAELASSLTALKKEYAPFLRSLPEKVSYRTQKIISGQKDWKRTIKFHEKPYTIDEPKDQMLSDFDDSKWETTLVPEWNYQTTGSHRPVNVTVWYRKHFNATAVPEGKRVFLVFNGVDWKSDIWLNGKKLGTHEGYWTPFRFDVTDILQKDNILSVRILDGRAFGEPCAHWPPLYSIPTDPVENQRYTRSFKGSIIGYQPWNYQSGSGFGIFRDVLLETTNQDIVTEILARKHHNETEASLSVKMDCKSTDPVKLVADIMPENFEGASFHKEMDFTPSGSNEDSTKFKMEMPDAKLWSPDTPYLYRVRITLKSEDGTPIDAQDTLFGVRSFTMASDKNPVKGFLPGTFFLNGKPCLLKGTNVQGFNMYWYWHQDEKLINSILLLKAGNFNAIRSCQHVMFREVRTLLDRLGIMSEQDQGARFPSAGEGANCGETLMRIAPRLAKEVYNNPGVVLISFANETKFNPKYLEFSKITHDFDPERIIVPISGIRRGGHININEGRKHYLIPQDSDLWSYIVEDYHPYWGWYKQHLGELWELGTPLEPAIQLSTVGEYGAEGLDSYETMSEHYPAHWGKTPDASEDTLYGEVQVLKHDVRQLVGFRGKVPQNLGEYIKASQTYQADIVGALTRTFRLSPKRIAGYFQFHFLDVMPASWPKALVSHDLKPKKAYYEMVQDNQSIVPLPVINDDGMGMQLWIASDKDQEIPGCTLKWEISAENAETVTGEQELTIPLYDAQKVVDVDLKSFDKNVSNINISLSLYSPDNKLISTYKNSVFIRLWREKEAVFKPLEKYKDEVIPKKYRPGEEEKEAAEKAMKEKEKQDKKDKKSKDKDKKSKDKKDKNAKDK